MDTTSLFVTIAALAYVGFMIYLANQEASRPGSGVGLRWMQYGVISGMVFVGLNVVAIAFLGGTPAPDAEPLAQITTVAALVNMVVVGLAAVLSGAVIVSPAARLALRGVLERNAGYEPDSPVHTTALILSLAFIGLNTTQFVLSGGLNGLAESIESSGVALDQVAFTGLLWVLAALLGVGLGLRRTGAEVAQRLGLRIPTREDLRQGLVVGIGLYAGSLVMALIWAALVSPETFAEQTAASQQLGSAINSLPLVLVVSLSAAIGEEIFFRGALQPIFGLVPTSLFFALIHTQYALTPASVWIIVVALVFGWLRRRTSTTAAIIAHFVYNFIPLLLVYTLSDQLTGLF